KVALHSVGLFPFYHAGGSIWPGRRSCYDSFVWKPHIIRTSISFFVILFIGVKTSEGWRFYEKDM
ncbi:MAG: hypothetical protein WDA02_11125, partial [Saccharofermentanales bacterium]